MEKSFQSRIELGNFLKSIKNKKKMIGFAKNAIFVRVTLIAVFADKHSTMTKTVSCR